MNFSNSTAQFEEQEATIAQQRKDFQASITSLEATVAQQQQQIEALTAGLHKVNAQLEVSKAARQVVANNQ